MNVLASECSSGCESGWTLYLEHSFLSPNPSIHTQYLDGEHYKGREYYEEEEDLSMVSDASSGPPHFHQDQDYLYPPSMDATLEKKTSGKRKKSKTHRCHRQEQEQPSLLDDTASSPVLTFSKNKLSLTHNQASMDSILDFSQGFSATYVQGGSAFQNRFGILQSPLSGNQLQQQNQWFEGKKVGMR